MADWKPTIYKSFLLASFISFLVGSFTSGKTSLGAYIAGYGVLSIGIAFLLLMLFAIMKMKKPDANAKWYTYVVEMMLNTGPFLFMLGVVGFILYLLIQFRADIVDGHIAPSYHSFSNIIVILLMLQLYFLYANIDNASFESTGKINPVIMSILYLLSVLTGISSAILYIILNYYSTDGFRNPH